MKKLTFFLALGMAVFFGAQQAKAATVDLSTLTADYVAQDGDILTGTLANNVKISIKPSATVTLKNARIYGTDNSSYAWAGLNCQANAIIILEGTCTVRGFEKGNPGIHIPKNYSLYIQGDGSLTASSNGAAAGIGGGQSLNCGNIWIQGGTIDATGGAFAAAIGGGRYGSCGNIYLHGGDIHATGGNNSPAIGSGDEGSCGIITIKCKDAISLRVDAVKGSYADYSVGKATKGSCTGIIVDNYTYPAGVSISDNPFQYEVNHWIDLSTLKEDFVAEDGDILTGTLSGNFCISVKKNASITLKDAVIDLVANNVVSKYGLFCIGNATITLEGTNRVIGGDGYSGISQGGKLTIQGSGSLEVTGGDNGAGIGSSNVIDGICGDIIIKSGTITATGGKNAAGIGCGSRANCGNITIEGGKVTAIKGEGALCSIGKGGNSSATTGTITIGGEVYVNGVTKSPYVFPEPTCKAPVDLKATNVSHNEATIIWYIGNIGQNKWYITYKSKDQSDFYSGEEVNTTAFTLKNLSPETEYEVKVKAICSSSDESEYTESIFFTTPQKPVANAQAYTVLNGTVLTYYYDNKYEEYEGTGYPVKMNSGSDGCVSNNYRDQVKTINIDPSMQNYTPTVMTRFFSASNPYAMEALTAINGLQYLNTSKVKYMNDMFYKCEALETIDLSSLNTSNVEDMNHMFYGCEKLATIIGIETLNTSKVTDMHDMFVACDELVKLDLHQWDVSSVTNMEYMFSTCKNLQELDLTGFDVSNVENMYAMFYESKQLTTIYCEDNWKDKATKLTNSQYMFSSCEALKGDNGTKWTAGNPKDITYARPDGGTEAPGYFSKKEATGIDETPSPSGEGWGEASKILRDGQLFILRGEKVYTITGAEVK